MTSPAAAPAAAVAYYRVSTQKQGVSGLGLEAQRAAVQALAAARGLNIAAEFTEVESGRKRDRPQLSAALDQARRMGAVLLIAKLDRLSRNVHFISGLMEAKVPFIAADMPDVDGLTLHVLAAVAQTEAEKISTRTREALAARKARGLPMGNPDNLTHAAREKGAQAQREAAVDATRQAAAYAQLMRERGDSYGKIAVALNAGGFRTRHGSLWEAKGVMRMLDRAAA